MKTLSIAECRRLLGVEAEGKSDEEIVAIREHLRPIAAVIVNAMRQHIRQSQKERGYE